MTNEFDRYTYRVIWSDEDQEFVGLCAEFPSLSWLDPLPEAALTGIRKIIIDVIQDMHANQETVPVALNARKYSGKFVVRVPAAVHQRLALEAAEAGVSLNRIVSMKLT